MSKECIDRINTTIRKQTNKNQWRSTDAVVTWFQNIESKDISSLKKNRYCGFLYVYIKEPYDEFY